MALLPEPFEFLDLHDGEEVRVRITGYIYGEADIAPRNPTPRHVAIMMEQKSMATAPAAGHPITVQVPVTRIYVMRLDKPTPVAYYDVSSKTLQAQLKPLLDTGAFHRQTYTITARGHAPHKRYSVEVT